MSIVRTTVDYASLSYPPPRGNVLLLGCMDLRLLDETLHFMNRDNLTNRYDHVILAGSALGALGAQRPEYAHWRKTFYDHLEVAVDLHNIQDVYLMEHRACGAYGKFLGSDGMFGDTPEELARETAAHRKYAALLTAEIAKWSQERQYPLRVRSFLMDLRGNVMLLDDVEASGAA
jgi:carbonic anhydrase